MSVDRELETFDMKQYVKMNYDVADYANRHIVPSVHYRGSNRHFWIQGLCR